MYLAFGASRLEAARPIAIEAIRLALLPVVNQMRWRPFHILLHLSSDLN